MERHQAHTFWYKFIKWHITIEMRESTTNQNECDIALILWIQKKNCTHFIHILSSSSDSPPTPFAHSFPFNNFLLFFLPAFAAFITRVICTHCRWMCASECIFMFESNGLTEFNKKCNGNVQIEWWLQCHNFSITCINSFGKKFGHDQWIWISVDR